MNLRKLLLMLAASVLLAQAPRALAATDTFTGSIANLPTHDSNWQEADTASIEPITNFGIDGSGFLVVSSTFKTPYAMYAGTDASQKSEAVFPIGAFVTVGASDYVGVAICMSTSAKGIEARIGLSQLTGQVVGSVRMGSSTGGFIAQQTLSPTIDTASVALTVSLQRTSATNVNLIVNGTTYPINTTGFDITTGQGGIFSARSGGTTTLKFDSWTNGVSASSNLLMKRRRH